MSIGIDIGNTSIKIVELKENGDKFDLKGSGIVAYNGKLPENQTQESDLTSLTDVIRKLHKDAGISKRDVNIALPESQVFTRIVKFPLLSDQEIASAIKWEAEQYIPIPLTEAIVQHQIIERNEKSTPPATFVLLVAVPRKLVEDYIKVVQKADLNVMGVESQLLSLTRSLGKKEGTMLLLDFGASSTNLAIVRNGFLAFSRSIPTGGSAFTRAVAQNLGIQEKQAEGYKRTYGMNPGQLEGKIKATIDPVFKLVVDEIGRAIHFYQTENQTSPPTAVVATGASVGMPGMVSTLSKQLGVEVTLGNPFAKVNLPENASKTILGYASMYGIATGLAMRD